MVYSRLVADPSKDTSKRAAYKAAEVCEIAHIQPYVLRSWESEFPKLGVLRAGIRIYRATDLEQVLRIKQLVFEEGLTLSGARRRIEEESGPIAELPVEEFVTPEMRQSIGHVKQGLRDLLEILGASEQAGAVPPATTDHAASLSMRLQVAGEERQPATPGNGRAKRAKDAKKKPPHAARSKSARGTRSSDRPRRHA